MSDAGSRAAAARALVAERFLAAAQSQPDTPEELIAFPAFMSLKNCKPLLDGTLNVTINVPQAFVPELYPKLVPFSELPMTVSFEAIVLPDIPDV